MFFVDLLFAFVIALLLAWIFGSGFRGRDNGDFLFFFILIMLFTWAGGVWLTPVGPLMWGVPWLSFLFVGLFFALLITAIIPDHHNTRRKQPKKAQVEEKKAVFVLDVFFWVLIIGLGLSILISYLW